MVSTFIVGLITVLGKNAFGWAKNSLEDGEVQGYEVKKGIVSIIIASVLFTGAYYGLQGFDATNSELWSSVVTLLVSPLLDKLFKRLNWF